MGHRSHPPPARRAPCYRPEPTVQTPPRDPRDGIDVPRARIHRDTRASHASPRGRTRRPVGSSEEKKTRRPVLSFSPPPPDLASATHHATHRLNPPAHPESVHAQFSGEHWPRLLRVKGKVPHVKTDFNKWVGEDEEEEGDRDASTWRNSGS